MREKTFYRIDGILNNKKFRSLMEQIEKKEADRIFCCHGLNHSMDVARIAYIINLEEQLSVSKEMIYAAALLHDIGRADPENTGVDHHLLSSAFAEEILLEAGFDDEERTQIQTAIATHNTDGIHRQGLPYLLFKADKLSRQCFDCSAYEACYWKDTEKNKGVQY